MIMLSANIKSKKSFLELFMGDMTNSEFMFSGFLIGMGALLWILYRIRNRKDKTTKPSFKLWFADVNNILAIPISLILTYISIRFYSNYQEYIINQLPNGFKSTPYFIMVVVGFLQHWLSEKINKATL